MNDTNPGGVKVAPPVTTPVVETVKDLAPLVDALGAWARAQRARKAGKMSRAVYLEVEAALLAIATEYGL